MGLASKIKNASSAPLTTPQPQQHAGSYEGGSAPSYDYRPAVQSTGSFEGAAPAQYGYPQQEYIQHGAPSAPPFTEPQQHYGGGNPTPHEYPVQLSPQQYYGAGNPTPHEYRVQPSQQVESTPYGVQGQTPPYGGNPTPHEYRVQPSQQVESTPYGVQGQTPPYGGKVQSPSSTYGAPQATAMMAQKLQAIIQANRLQAFYDPAGRFQATLQKVAAINFAEIAAQWKISVELAYDLAPLALYDIVFYCDDSGSMAFEENGERIDDLKFILSKVSSIANKFDDDGIRVRFMNSDVNGDGIHNDGDVEKLISKVRFSGMTPLGTNLDRKVIQPFVLGQAQSIMAKPVLAIIITDGEPSGEDRGTIRQVVHRAKDALTRTPYGGGAFAVQIAQVGKDANTQKFLESLDKDPIIGGMIDCTSYYELEEAEFAKQGVTLTPELWLLKLCVGAIDPEYDSKDT